MFTTMITTMVMLTINCLEHFDIWILGCFSLEMSIRNNIVAGLYFLCFAYLTLLHKHSRIFLFIFPCSFIEYLADIRYFLTNAKAYAYFYEDSIKMPFPEVFCIVRTGVICQK